MRFAIYQDSHIGGRASNQDRMGYCFTREALLMLLADGMVVTKTVKSQRHSHCKLWVHFFVSERRQISAIPLSCLMS